MRASLGIREAAPGKSVQNDRWARGIVDEVVETDVADYNVHCRAPEPTEGLLSMSSEFALFVFDWFRVRINPRERRLSRVVPKRKLPRAPSSGCARARLVALEDALQLVHLHFEQGSPKAEPAARRWLVRYLSEARRACGMSRGDGESGDADRLDGTRSRFAQHGSVAKGQPQAAYDQPRGKRMNPKNPSGVRSVAPMTMVAHASSFGNMPLRSAPKPVAKSNAANAAFHASQS